MTEDEAKGKWCPNSSMAVFEECIVDNRGDFFSGKPCRCLASGCMVWRWETFEPNDSGKIANGYGGWDDPEGYCGLIKA